MATGGQASTLREALAPPRHAFQQSFSRKRRTKIAVTLPHQFPSRTLGLRRSAGCSSFAHVPCESSAIYVSALSTRRNSASWTASPLDKRFVDKAFGKDLHRPQLEQLTSYVREGGRRCDLPFKRIGWHATWTISGRWSLGARSGASMFALAVRFPLAVIHSIKNWEAGVVKTTAFLRKLNRLIAIMSE